MHFRVAVGEYLPFLVLITNNGDLHMTGPLADAFHVLAERLNFTYSLHRAEGDTWGIHGPNGWTGLLGMLARNEVDFALGPFTLTYSRASAFQVSVPMYVDTVEILAPSMEWTMSLFNMISVFTYHVWFLLLFTVVSLCIMLGVIEKYEYSDRNFIQCILRSFWDVLRTLLQKGRQSRPTGIPRVILTVLWMLTAMVISYLFCGVIHSNLLLKRARKIDSINDLDASEDMQPILENQSSIYGNFRDGKSAIQRSIFSKVLRNPDQCVLSFKNMSSIGMDLVQSKSFSMITDGMGLRHFLAKRHTDGLPCNYRLAQETMWPLWKVIAFGEGFPQAWIQKINRILRHTFESRWLHQRMINEFSGYTECLTSGNVDVESLHLEHIVGIFIIWAVGVIVSAFALVIEMYCHKKTTVQKFVNYTEYSKTMGHVSNHHSKDTFYSAIQRIMSLQYLSRRDSN